MDILNAVAYGIRVGSEALATSIAENPEVAKRVIETIGLVAALDILSKGMNEMPSGQNAAHVLISQ